MDANEQNKRGANELNGEELEEVSGGGAHGVTLCRCPTCNQVFSNVVGSLCPYCGLTGVESRMVK